MNLEGACRKEGGPEGNTNQNRGGGWLPAHAWAAAPPRPQPQRKEERNQPGPPDR